MKLTEVEAWRHHRGEAQDSSNSLGCLLWHARTHAQHQNTHPRPWQT